jgi:hypothetical protein
MKRPILRICLFGLLAAGIAGASAHLRAQETNQATIEKKENKPRRHSVTPFHGRLKSVDTTARTLSVGELSIHITADTKIDKSGKPAALEDAVAGEVVSGGYVKAADGKCIATTLHLGPKEAPGHPKRNPSGHEAK